MDSLALLHARRNALRDGIRQHYSTMRPADREIIADRLAEISQQILRHPVNAGRR